MRYLFLKIFALSQEVGSNEKITPFPISTMKVFSVFVVAAPGQNNCDIRNNKVWCGFKDRLIFYYRCHLRKNGEKKFYAEKANEFVLRDTKIIEKILFCS